LLQPGPEPRTGTRAWVGRLFRSVRARDARAAVEADPLLAFESEQEPGPVAGHSRTKLGPSPADPASRRRFWAAIAAAVIGVLVAVGAGVMAYNPTASSAALLWARSLPGSFTTPAPATLTVTTRPEGAQVSLDGEPRGVTPLTLSVPPGEHQLRVRVGSQERVLSLTAAPGADIARDFELVAPVAATGGLSVVTDPPGAQVTIDGRHSGASPVNVDALAVGDHTIAIAGATGSAERTVAVSAGQNATVYFSLPRVAGPVGGFLSVSVPFEIQVVERGEVIGASGSTRIMLPAGRHDITLVNKTLEFQDSRRVDIVAGQTTVVRIDPPRVRVNINARPWAEVSIDGQDFGQTPISNATITVGTHQLVFRHPQLGERRQSVVITTKGPQRLAVDLTQ
jgi:hypothetical protein